MDIEILSATAVRVGSETLNAEQIEELVNKLAIARSQLQPPVPMRVEQGRGNVVMQPDPQVEIGGGPDGKIRLAFRHTGFGWLTFALDRRTAAFIRDVLTKRISGIPVHTTLDEHGGAAKH